MSFIDDFLPEEDRKTVKAAIEEAELNTSGEIRVHIEPRCKEDVLDRAAFIFEKLGMHKTKLRNGVLFYVSVKDHQFAILGDAGINKVVPDDFWDEIKETVINHFKEGRYKEGFVKGILMAGEQLKHHFPYQTDDKNELSDEISIG